MTTIRDIEQQAKAEPGTQAAFSELWLQVESLGQGRQGPTAELKDASGTTRRFNLVDVDTPQIGQAIAGAGTMKEGTQGQAGRRPPMFRDLRAWQPAGQPPAQQAPAGGGQRQASGHERTAASAAKVVQWLWQESEGWGVEGEEARQKLVGSILIGYIDGKLALPDRRPGEQPQARQPAPPPPQPAPPPPAEGPEEYPDNPPDYEDDERIPF